MILRLKHPISILILGFVLLSGTACSDKDMKSLRSLFIEVPEQEAPAPPPEEKDAGKPVVRIKKRADGTVKSKIRYRYGVKDGLAEQWYDNGNMRASIEYKSGMRHGTAKMYYEKGGLFRETEYQNDRKDGMMTIYRANGKVKAKIPYKNGHPGIGTQEFYVSGKAKTEYPELLFDRINKLASENRYLIEVELSEKGRDATFYYGQLIDGKYFHNGMIMLETPEKEKGLLEITLPPGTQVNETLNIVAVAETSMGNPYVVQKELPVSIQN
ncbi:toxin-antitoxin system YwqK family antitoxin [Roseivirga sp. BDSF3-8]|uniref:toxin-antitoxin system YwqK family antitoxin n=1 Tax=Roseivirga sp. BDSF3-8 TaxID=3241598 RepID=UPI00353198DD